MNTSQPSIRIGSNDIAELYNDEVKWQGQKELEKGRKNSTQ